MDVLTLYVGNDMLLEVEGLTDDAAGTWVNDASVTVTLKDAAGNEVGGDTWPKAMAYVTGTDGLYRVTLADTLGITANARYVAHVVADSGPGRRAAWEMDVLAKARRR